MSQEIFFDSDSEHTPTSGTNTPLNEFESNFATNFPEHEAKLAAARFGCSLDDPQCKDMILVMGKRGAGKSSFINTLVGGDVAEIGDGNTACTKNCLLVPTRVGKSKVILIDTPGCRGYCNYPGATFFTQMFTTLARQYQRGISLRGIIYIQRLPVEPELGDLPAEIERLLRMFQDICGDSNLLFRNIILATRGWQLPELDESVAAVRENEYCKMWMPILDRGPTMARYYGERDSAVSMTSRILGNIDLPHESEQDLVQKGTNIMVQMRASVARDLDRLLQRGLSLRDDLRTC